MPDPMPLAALTYNPATGLYGFRVWFEGHSPHHVMETFESRLRYCVRPKDAHYLDYRPYQRHRRSLIGRGSLPFCSAILQSRSNTCC
jgi:hypothetical protein